MSNKASSLDSSSASRLSSCSSSIKRFSMASDLCSMSYTGRQFSIASKRRQGGKVETHSDLVMGLEAGELEEVVIAVVAGERNQEQQRAGRKR